MPAIATSVAHLMPTIKRQIRASSSLHTSLQRVIERVVVIFAVLDVRADLCQGIYTCPHFLSHCRQICRSTCLHTFSSILCKYGPYSYGLYRYGLYSYGCTPFASLRDTPLGCCKAVSCMCACVYAHTCMCACVCVPACMFPWSSVFMPSIEQCAQV